MNKIRFLSLLLLLLPAPSFAQTEQVYTPPPMFGTPVVTPQPVQQQPAPEPILQQPVQPPYVQQQTTAPTQLQPETITPTPAPVVIAPAPVPTPAPAPQTKPVPTKSASAEALLNHPVTAAPSPNTIDPLMASQIAKSKMPKPKDGEIVDDTGVDPSKVRYPNQKTAMSNPIKPAKPIIEDTSTKKNDKSKSKNITTEQQKMPVVTTKNVEELSLAPMPNVKVSNAKEKTPAAVPAPAPTASTSSQQTLAFTAGAGDLTPAHKSSLAGIVAGLKAKPTARAQISSYATPTNATGSTSARRVSLTRGLAIRTYLLSQGIDGGRVDVKALGDETGGKGKLDQVNIVIME